MFKPLKAPTSSFKNVRQSAMLHVLVRGSAKRNFVITSRILYANLSRIRLSTTTVRCHFMRKISLFSIFSTGARALFTVTRTSFLLIDWCKDTSYCHLRLVTIVICKKHVIVRIPGQCTVLHCFSYYFRHTSTIYMGLKLAFRSVKLENCISFSLIGCCNHAWISIYSSDF